MPCCAPTTLAVEGPVCPPRTRAAPKSAGRTSSGESVGDTGYGFLSGKGSSGCASRPPTRSTSPAAARPPCGPIAQRLTDHRALELRGQGPLLPGGSSDGVTPDRGRGLIPTLRGRVPLRAPRSRAVRRCELSADRGLSLVVLRSPRSRPCLTTTAPRNGASGRARGLDERQEAARAERRPGARSQASWWRVRGCRTGGG